MGNMEFSEHLRQSRLSAGLSQAVLARRAGTSQARLSSYEAGRVVPMEATRTRLERAMQPLPSVALGHHRNEVLALARRYGLFDVRVFGSVARGTDTPASDVDLLVTPDTGVSLLGISAFADEVEVLLGCDVDVASDRGLSPTSPILAEATRL